jgi:phosphonate transport system substrate-binding protein
MKMQSLLSFFLFCFAVMISIPVLADCQRGALDHRFCDRDGDLIADPPDEPSKWLDPYPLVFAYTPVEDPNVYKRAWSDFIAYVGKVTGRKVVLFPIQSNAAEVKAMRYGKIHVAGYNTGSTPLAVNCAGFHPFTIMARADYSYGYEMEIITYPGSGINKVTDIKGKSFVFTAPTSNSGFKAASAILQDEFGLVKGRDFDYSFSGKHGSSVLGVKNHQYKAASIANSVRKRMLNRGSITDNDLKVLYKSRTFPNTAFGYAYNLKPELAEKIRLAFETFQWDKADGSPSSLKLEFSSSDYARFIPVSYKNDWEIIRQIDRVYQPEFSCD